MKAKNNFPFNMSIQVFDKKTFDKDFFVEYKRLEASTSSPLINSLSGKVEFPTGFV
jgi:hypothetical protein